MTAAGSIWSSRILPRSRCIRPARTETSPQAGRSPGITRESAVRWASRSTAGDVYTSRTDRNLEVTAALRVYAPNAEGEDDPVRVLAGPATTLAQPMDIEFDSHGDMYLPNTSGNSPGQVAVFRRKAHGNEPPIRTITGPETLLRRPIKLAFGRGDTLYALNIFDWSRSPCVYSGPVNVTVTVYPPGASGNVEPVRSITVTQEGKSVGRERGLNGMRNLVVDRRGAVRLWHPDGEVTFAPGASGAAAPVRSTTESGVPRGAAAGVAVADDGTIYETSVPVSRVCL